MKSVRHKKIKIIGARSAWGIRLLIAAFAAGAVICELVLRYAPFNADIAALDFSGSSPGSIFFSCIFFSCVSCFFASSTLGGAFITSAAFVFGCAITYKADTIISAGIDSAFVNVTLSIVIPALLTVPPFFVVSQRALEVSRSLITGSDGRRPSCRTSTLLFGMAFAILLSAAAAAYILYLLPEFTM